MPPDNPLTEARVELGRHLFFDPRLSLDGSFSCASCHQPARAFTDGRSRAVGVTGERHRRNTMSLTNVVYNSTLTWADPNLRRLEDQMQVPMFSRDPVELGLEGIEGEVLERLRREPRYAELFEGAFPGETGPIGLDAVRLAIASFERTLVSGDSPYDRYVYWGEGEDFSAASRRGMRLFFSQRLGCSGCHGGFNFSGPVVYRGARPPAPVFHNTGLYNLRGTGAYPEDDRGLIEHTGEPDDMGRFRAPTLRNIAVTAPYMHDGSLATLEQVIGHYAAGGRTLPTGPLAGVGRDNPHKSPDIGGFELSEAEIGDLKSFLESLTDETFLRDPRFDDPWAAP